ncbi:hypothetical protein NM208_g6318 [Fusarium decemcellulare]|uniref:Uncharacterized protein n=1 Tax=Fusarium decemcellulare TaxID=57161 RepID=A0ACC1SDJ4_9HYPO|nr:hypothetical protein NM208_g6318 [Fusarium decemcellulare]
MSSSNFILTDEALSGALPQMAMATKAIHADDFYNPHRAIAPGIHVAVNYRYARDPDNLVPMENDDPNAPNDSHVYSRYTAPNSNRFETVLRGLFNAECVSYSIGISAFLAMMLLLNPKRIFMTDGYHGVHGVVDIMARTTKVQKLTLEEIDQAGPGDVIHVETPLNPTGESRNIAYYKSKATAVGAYLTVDSTFAPPPLQDPIQLGVDVVLHSGTKYLGGHSDMLCGILVVHPERSKEGWTKTLYHDRQHIGSVMGTLEAWLGIRSLRTLQLRVTRQSENALALVQWLSQETRKDGKERGYTAAPRPLPIVAVAMARALRFPKYSGTMAMDGIEMKHIPRPTQIPWARRICQNLVLMLVSMKPPVSKAAPAMIISWVSNAGNVLPREWEIFPPIGYRLLECGSVDPFEQGYWEDRVIAMWSRALTPAGVREHLKLVYHQHPEAESSKIFRLEYISMYDLVVVGHGIASLAAAVSAAEFSPSAQIAVLEHAPEHASGGNSRWSPANMRMPSVNEVLPGFVDDMVAASGSGGDRAYFERLASQAPEALQWLEKQGVQFHAMDYFLKSWPNRIQPIGKGAAIVEALKQSAKSKGVQLVYNCRAQRLHLGRGQAMIEAADGRRIIARSVVLASGGFQGSPDMLRTHLGPGAETLRPISPGTAWNAGDGIQMALANGAKASGDWNGMHSEVIDPRSSQPAPLVLNYPYGVVVNQDGKRFVDEGAGLVHDTWEHLSRTIHFDTPGRLAWAICDSRFFQLEDHEAAIRSDMPPVTADTISGLAAQMGMPEQALLNTILNYNAACNANMSGFTAGRLDNLATTSGLQPSKSNWARPLDAPPYTAFPLAAAIVYTFGGIATDVEARVLGQRGIIPNLYAAGEITGHFYEKAPNAVAVMRALVFGRIAGLHAISSH